jgi:hypothetical protein
VQIFGILQERRKSWAKKVSGFEIHRLLAEANITDVKRKGVLIKIWEEKE